MARPKALDTGLMFEICERIAEGETVRQIANDEHMPCARTIYLSLATDAQFSHQYAQAREAQLERWEDEIVEIADDGTNDWMQRRGKDGELLDPMADHEHISRSKVRIDARKWLMAKRMPKKYGDRVEHEVNQTVRDITDEPVNADEWADRHVTAH